MVFQDLVEHCFVEVWLKYVLNIRCRVDRHVLYVITWTGGSCWQSRRYALLHSDIFSPEMFFRSALSITAVVVMDRYLLASPIKSSYIWPFWDFTLCPFDQLADVVSSRHVSLQWCNAHFLFFKWAIITRQEYNLAPF